MSMDVCLHACLWTKYMPGMLDASDSLGKGDIKWATIWVLGI